MISIGKDYFNQGVIDSDGNIIVEPEYSNGTLFIYGSMLPVFWFYDGRTSKVFLSKTLLRTFPGKVRVRSVLDEEQLIIIEQEDQFAAIDFAGRDLVSLRRGSYSGYAEGMFLIKVGDRYQFLDRNGKLPVNATFENANIFSESLAPVKSKNKWGFLNIKGTWAIQATFDEARQFQNGLAAVKVADQWGYIDRSSKFIIPPQFKDADEFTMGGIAKVLLPEGCQIVSKNGTLGPKGDYCNVKGNQLIQISSEGSKRYVLFNERSEFIELGEAGESFPNYFSFYQNGRIGLVSPDTGFVISPEYDSIRYNQTDGLYILERNGLTDVLNPNGSWFLKGTKENIFGCKENICITVDRKTGRKGYIGSNLKKITENVFTYADSFSDGLAKVFREGNWEYIDTTGKTVFKGAYKNSGNFFQGLVWFEQNGKFGYLDRNGQIQIPTEFDTAGNFSDSFAIAKKDGRFGLIDTKGEFVISPMFESIELIKPKRYRVQFEKQYGILNLERCGL
ncbi:WG repeat-containing protein [Leptospira licerasiae]|uniref:WG repeat-containing protein n=1 Tax=Leptospira licerasiae TaxID=447106 RepID=UPI0010841DC3|nr:WG repeat-containing protein [Leptospira licerasiae]TGM90127.1 WG repeat-containing protein [Leptospira licerasiae]